MLTVYEDYNFFFFVRFQIVMSMAAVQKLPQLALQLEKDSPAEKFYSKLKFGVQRKYVLLYKSSCVYRKVGL